MNAAAAKLEPGAHPDLVMTRIYEAPKALVWQAITEPGHLARWFGPHGFDDNTASVDLRPGGDYSIIMRRGGHEHPAVYEVAEVSPTDRLVLETAQGDHETQNFHRVRLSFDLEERGTQTVLTLTGKVLEAEAKATGPLAGPESAWSQSLERLAGTLGSLVIEAPAGDPVIKISRIFKFSRERVWEAMSKPEHLKEWWGPREAENTEVAMDFRVGGAWRVVQRFPDGSEFVFKGTYREIEPPEKLVQTFGMEGEFAGAEMVEEMTLTPLGDVTLLQVVSRADSLEARDGMLASGMSQGANETYQRLEDYLDTMPRTA